MFLDVRFDRKEILIDEGRDFIVGIGFGLQPNARASNRSSAEVEQQGLLVSLCLSECRINVFVPLNSRFQNLLKNRSDYGAKSYPCWRSLQEDSPGDCTSLSTTKLSNGGLRLPRVIT